MNSQEINTVVPAVEVAATLPATVSLEAEKGKPVAAKRAANINEDPNFTLEARNLEVATIAAVITQSGIQCEVLKDDKTEADFVKVNANLLICNEYFKNSAIGKSEWKARIYLRGKLVTHYKAKNTSKIVDLITKLLPSSQAEAVTTPA